MHNNPEQKDYDVKRQKYLETFGITFIRVTNEELLANANMAFARIEVAIKKLKQK